MLTPLLLTTIGPSLSNLSDDRVSELSCSFCTSVLFGSGAGSARGAEWDSSADICKVMCTRRCSVFCGEVRRSDSVYIDRDANRESSRN